VPYQKKFFGEKNPSIFGGSPNLTVYYKESVWVSWWVWALFIVTSVFLSSVFFVQSVFGIPVGTKPAPNFVLLILLVFLGFIIFSFRKLNLTVDSENIEVNYGAVKKKIAWSEVVFCEPTKAKLTVYGGVGIRLGIDKSLAFTTSFGNAVKIVRKNGLPFIFSTNNPKKVSNIVNEILSQSITARSDDQDHIS